MKKVKLFCEKCGIRLEKSQKIFAPLLVTNYHQFHKDLDSALAIFLNENMTIENRKTLSDFSIMDFLTWSSTKKKEDTLK